MRRPYSSSRLDRTSSRDGESPERGTTLAELAVGLLVSSLVLASAYGAYRFAARGAALWQSRQQAASMGFLLERRIAGDVRESARIATGPATLALIGAGGDTTALYALEGDVLTRNGRFAAAASSLSAQQAGSRVVVTAQGSRRIVVEARLRAASAAQWLPGTAGQEATAVDFLTPSPIPARNKPSADLQQM